MMELWILLLLIGILCCMILFFIVFFTQRRKQEETSFQMLLQNKESLTKSEMMEKQTQQVFQNVLVQLQEMKNQQGIKDKTMMDISSSLQNMHQVMTNTKMRGNWGEYQLDLLLSSFLGEHDNVYQSQYTLSNGKIADAVLFMPGESKVLCIDSKFPLENYLKIQKENADQAMIRQFKTNVKKHIDDVAEKYITLETTKHALLFVPNEAIYQYICAECEDLFLYALHKHVEMTSPTTLIGILFSFLESTKEFYRANHIEDIEKNILLLQEDVHRLLERSQKAEKSLESLAQQFHQVSISATKIARRMDSISKGQDNKEELD